MCEEYKQLSKFLQLHVLFYERGRLPELRNLSFKNAAQRKIHRSTTVLQHLHESLGKRSLSRWKYKNNACFSSLSKHVLLKLIDKLK